MYLIYAGILDICWSGCPDGKRRLVSLFFSFFHAGNWISIPLRKFGISFYHFFYLFNFLSIVLHVFQSYYAV